MPSDGKAIIKRYDVLKQQAQQHFSSCDKMAPFLAPSRVGITGKRSPGSSQTQGVYDSQTMLAAELCAHFIAGQIINPSQLWGTMSLRHPRKRDNDAINEWLEESRDRQLKEYSRSMFYAEGVESLIDTIGFGTGCLLREERPQPVNQVLRGFRGWSFQAMKTGRFLIADGTDGLVDALYNEREMSAKMLKDRFGDTKLPEKVKRAIAEEKFDEPFCIVHAVYPRSVADQRHAAGAMGMPWASCWVEKDSKELIHESGYTAFPGSVYRYTRTPGEVFGRGRGHLAWPDTWTLNTTKRMGLEDWALKIRPPVLTAHDSVIGTLRLTPGGPTSVNTRGRSLHDVIAPYQTGSHPEVSQIKEEELRKSIRQIFFVDQILMLMEVNKSEMTAEEWRSKIGLLFKIMGPVYGRMEHEWLRREWDGAFEELLEKGVFSPPPDAIYETDGNIELTFNNPIARAQRRGDVEAMTMTVQDLLPFAQFAPSVFDRMDPRKSADMIMEINGYPARATRNDDEMEALAQERQAQQAQEQQLAQAGQIADAAGAAAPMLTALQGGTRPR
jgi:hypothetical protein